MTSTVRRLALLLAFAMGLSLVVAPAVAAHDSSSAALPTRIDLPSGWQPEGITSWGKWLFAGSLKDGAILPGEREERDGSGLRRRRDWEGCDRPAHRSMGSTVGGRRVDR